MEPDFPGSFEINSGRLSVICPSALLSIHTLTPGVIRPFLLQKDWSLGFARSMPTVVSSSTAPNTSSAGNWKDNTSWRRSRRTTVEFSSSTRGRSSRRFLFRSSERSLILSPDPSSVHDVLTVGSIRKLFTMFLRLPPTRYADFSMSQCPGSKLLFTQKPQKNQKQNDAAFQRGQKFNLQERDGVVRKK